MNNPSITKTKHVNILCSVGAGIFARIMNKIRAGGLAEDLYRELNHHRDNCQECRKEGIE